MILESAHRSRDEQLWRAARRRIRETLAVRRAAAASGQRTVAASGQPHDRSGRAAERRTAR